MYKKTVGVVVATLVTGVLAVTQANTASAHGAELCGVRVHLPHASLKKSQEIHTRAESYCRTAVLYSNSIAATTYRKRNWFGWKPVGTAGNSRVAQEVRVTVAVPCEAGKWARYKTAARGTVLMHGHLVTAASYEDTDVKIKCTRF